MFASGSWLPQETLGDEQSRGLWTPSDLPVDPGGLSYIVVEEIVGNAIGLAVSDWPEVDLQGRLRFSNPARLVGIDRPWLERELSEHRTLAGMAERPLRIGDAFAVGGVVVGPGETELTVTAWQPPIYDITTQARAAAKTALYGAVAPVLDAEQARELNPIIEERED